MTARWLAVALVALGIALSGCKSSSANHAHDNVAKDFDVHECAACGMIIREQPAPRAQVMHKDGTRQFFCSVSDMVTYLSAPTPNGRVVGSWVETMDSVAAPLVFDTKKLPWIPASTAGYVTGIDKKRIMGTPVLVYSDIAGAKRAAKQHGGKSTSWTDLRSSLTKAP